MLKRYTFFLAFLLLSMASLHAQSDGDTKTKGPFFNPIQHIMPLAYATANGTAGFTGPLSSTARTYQLLINENQLTGLVNKNIISLAFRNQSGATTTWPTAEVTYNSYDIYLSGSVAPSARSLTFSENIVGQQVQVRNGPLVIAANSYPIGGSPNLFGPAIQFTTPYHYTGGHLLVEIRQNASNGTSRAVDAVGTAITGYGTDFSACWVGSYTGTTGSQGNFSIIALESDDQIPVELTSFEAVSSGNSVNLTWSTATETNNAGFEIERKTGSGEFEKIAFVTGFGTTAKTQNYSYNDEALAKGSYTYRLKQTDFDGTFSYSNEVESDITAELKFSLTQNYPNPFNPSTKIEFIVAEPGFVKVSILNITGEIISVPVKEFMQAGKHSITFDASGLPSGIYLYKLDAGNSSFTRKMILAK
ncbi:MAG: T9SS type A sorting domain-containing protein [Ignavibacteriaceae bacterium]|nr:T9SS type A sorting domain-containing protein [Ignavibacteriaceae bacterium]